MKSLFSIDGYLAVIPQIQNIYPPEKDRVGWCFGFKYVSGIFEFFTYKTFQQARGQYRKLAEAVEAYYKKNKVVVCLT